MLSMLKENISTPIATTKATLFDAGFAKQYLGIAIRCIETCQNMLITLVR